MKREYVNELLRYVGCNEYNGTHKPIIDMYNTITPLPRGYKVQYSDSWCATFISAIAHKLKMSPMLFPYECSCNRMLIDCKALGILTEDESIIPKVGMIVFYSWSDNGKGDCTLMPNHVGVVCEVFQDTQTFSVVEGNKNNAVGVRKLPFNARYLRAFAMPKYAQMERTQTTNTLVIDNRFNATVRNIISGAYGNGEERKNRLRKLGFSDKEIQEMQNEVNRILKKV